MTDAPECPAVGAGCPGPGQEMNMKKLSELLSEKRIVIDFKAGGKKEAMERLLDHAVEPAERAPLLQSLLEREDLGSTGIGSGVAVPHVRVDSVDAPVVVFGRSAKPVAFDAVDGEPCSLFFLVLGPTKQDAQEAYLHAMAKISRLMRQAPVRDRLMKAATAADAMVAVRAGEG